MGNAINTTSMTIDGVTDVSEWFVVEGDHDTASRNLFVGAAGLLVGRKSYEGFAGYWPTQTGEWADMLNPLPKFVATRSLPGPLDWNATALTGEASETVARLKQEVDGDLILSGCGELARDLLRAGLIDEVRFWVHPTVWGPGTRPFLGEKVPMELVDSIAYPSGVVQLHYRPTR